MILSVLATTLAMAILPARGGMGNDPLSDFRWKRRVLLIFGNDLNESVVEQGDRLDARQSEVNERQLTVLTVVNGIVADSGRYDSLPSAEALRAKFRVKEQTPFTVILVGKDGQEKLRDTAPVEANALFELIDSMPMRQDEIRKD